MAPKGEKVEQEENRMAPRGSCTLLPPISLSLILWPCANGGQEQRDGKRTGTVYSV